MIRALTLSCIAAISILATGKPNNPVTLGPQAIKVATSALEAKFGKKMVTKHSPYEAHLKEGVWYISSAANTTPGRRGGGSPEAEIQASTGEIIKLYLAR